MVVKLLIAHVFIVFLEFCQREGEGKEKMLNIFEQKKRSP